jgi:hypothetical protein
LRPSKKTLFASYVWGRDYIDNFCSMVLPSQLATDNIPAIAKNVHVEYLIVTRSDDIDRWREKKVIQRLDKLCKTSFITVDETHDTAEYSLVGKMQWLSMVYARAFDFDFIFPLYADAICSKNSMINAHKRLEEGYDAVLTLGLLTIKKTLATKLQKFLNNNVLEIDSRSLVDVVFESIHPFHKAMFLSEKQFTTNPSFFIAEVCNGSYRSHSFHHHPFAMAVPEIDKLRVPFTGTLDQHFLPYAFADPFNLYVAQDSDELFICSFDDVSEKNVRVSAGQNPASISSIATFAEVASTPMQRHLFALPMTFHGNILHKGKTQKSGVNSQIIADAVLRELSTPDSVLRQNNALAYRARQIANARVVVSQKQFVKSALALKTKEYKKIEVLRFSCERVDVVDLLKSLGYSTNFNRYYLLRVITNRLVFKLLRPFRSTILTLLKLAKVDMRSNPKHKLNKARQNDDIFFKQYISKVSTATLLGVFFGL